VKILQQIEEHLKRESPDGIPNDWFKDLRRHVEPTEQGAHVESRDLGSKQGSLLELRLEAETCQKCRLCEERTKVVFGVGNENRPRIVFVGEGPGREEDLKGEPFVGKAGQLLTAAIEKGLGLKRTDVYICNVVKCRPPQNRTPLPDEVAACSHYLEAQLEFLKPEVIVTLGSPAQLALTGVERGITKLRGTWLEWRGIKVMPTFHPAYILRNPAAKKPFWHDLQAVMEHLGMQL
jgi:DNA polymerase